MIQSLPTAAATGRRNVHENPAHLEEEPHIAPTLGWWAGATRFTAGGEPRSGGCRREAAVGSLRSFPPVRHPASRCVSARCHAVTRRHGDRPESPTAIETGRGRDMHIADVVGWRDLRDVTLWGFEICTAQPCGAARIARYLLMGLSECQNGWQIR